MKKFCINENCKKEFDARNDKHVFCSQKCRTQHWKVNHQWNENSIFGNTRHESKVITLPIFHVQSGKIYSEIKKSKRISDLWIFANSILWPNQDFREDQENQFKQLIKAYFLNVDDIDGKFKELVERIVLAKRYVQEKSYRFVAPPLQYLDIKYFDGLYGTGKWYQAMQHQRETKPAFAESLSVFSEAILKFSEQRNILDILFYRHLFITLDTMDLLQWYLNAIMHYQFINF